jgi:antibiotic biosynthesis monooxygenase (ABM) superfamily enzyme
MEAFMVARIWHGYSNAEHADKYEAMLKPELLPGISKVAGYRGSLLLRRSHAEEIEFITVLFFDSIDNIRAVAGPDYELAVIPENRRKHLTRWDTHAKHYEVASVHGIASLLS